MQPPILSQTFSAGKTKQNKTEVKKEPQYTTPNKDGQKLECPYISSVVIQTSVNILNNFVFRMFP